MKKMLIGALAVTMAFSFAVTGCGSSGSESADASGNASGDASGDVEKPEYDALDYVTLGDYMGVEVTAVKYEATQDDYDEYVQDLLEGEVEYVESDKTTVEDGDMVNIDYVGTIDGEEFDGGSSEDYDLEIGSGSFIDDFEDQLIGSSVGDTVEVNITFPDDYYDEDTAGKDAVFTCTINSIKEEQIPEYTDDFVNEYTGGEYTTTADYDEYIWDELESEARSNTDDAVDEAVKDAVYAVCEVNGQPDGLFEYYFAQYRSYYETYAENYGYDLETFVTSLMGYESLDELDEEMTTDINETIIPELLVSEALVEAEGIEPTDEIINNYIAWYASYYYGYDNVDEFYSAYGLEDADAFADALGEETVNNEACQLEVWSMITENAIITYTEEADESGDYEIVLDESGDSDYEVIYDDEDE